MHLDKFIRFLYGGFCTEKCSESSQQSLRRKYHSKVLVEQIPNIPSNLFKPWVTQALGPLEGAAPGVGGEASANSTEEHSVYVRMSHDCVHPPLVDIVLVTQRDPQSRPHDQYVHCTKHFMRRNYTDYHNYNLYTLLICKLPFPGINGSLCTLIAIMPLIYVGIKLCCFDL